MQTDDVTFVERFLEFLNDKTASAPDAQERFRAHPYCAERLGIFKTDFAARDFLSMQADMKARLLKLIKNGLSKGERIEMVEKLNSLRFSGHLVVGKTANHELILEPVTIGALGEYKPHAVAKKAVMLRTVPTISGMEGACWFALMLISSEPERIRQCRLAKCENFFIKSNTRKNFCSRSHADDHDSDDAARRVRQSRERAKKKRRAK
jgi:hypothetical protein